MPTRPCAVGILADLDEDLADGRHNKAVRASPVTAIAAKVALDQCARTLRVLADLGLDLVDEPGWTWLGSSGVRAMAGWYADTPRSGPV